MSEFMEAAHAALEDRPGTKTIDGVVHFRNAQGAYVPHELVKPQHELEDDTVRKVAGYALELQAQIARFRQHSFDDVDLMLGILAQEYGDQRGGTKGNITLTSYDGLLQVKVVRAELIEFGPSLQNCRNLVDECLNEWAEGARAEIRVIVQQAFDTDKEGKLSRTRLLGLRRLEITDPRWVQAMRALDDSITVQGSKRYVNVYRRAKTDAKWERVSIDLASA